MPENFDGDATNDRLDPTGKAQVDLVDPIAGLYIMYGSTEKW